MNFAQTRAFHFVAKEGGVARAAAVLGVAQPTISQHLKALEAQTGARLFEKQGRRLALTEAGRDLFSVTERLISAAEAVDAALRRPSGLSGGRLRLASDSTTLAFDIVARFRARHPEVSVSVRIASVDAVMAAVENLKAEVGVTVQPPIDDDLHIAPLREEPIMATMAAGAALAAVERPTLEQIAGETLLMRERGSRTRAICERALAAAGVALRDVIEIDDRAAIREAAARGLGVAFFAASECPPDARLAHRPINAGRVRLRFEEYVVARRSQRRNAVVRAFLDAAREI